MSWDADWFSTAAHSSMLAWRGVEDQYSLPTTVKLVDSPEEHDLLDEMLEESKPPLPPEAESKHYLLASPFRYQPRSAHRFRPASEKGQWYGSESIEASCAELAYWKNRFWRDSVGLHDVEIPIQLVFYQARVSGYSIDLRQEPWVQNRAQWTHGADYGACHALAKAAQERGIEWISYESVRAPGARCAVAFTPSCMFEPEGSTIEQTIQRWACKYSRSRVMFMSHGQPGYTWDF